jgi:hypothetical protein
VKNVTMTSRNPPINAPTGPTLMSPTRSTGALYNKTGEAAILATISQANSLNNRA